MFKKEKLNKLINIDEYKKSIRDLDRFRNNLLKHIGNNELFELDSLDEIIFYSLNSLYPINKNLKILKNLLSKKLEMYLNILE